MLQISGATEKLQLVTSAAGSIQNQIDYAVWDLTTGLPTVASPANQCAVITTAATTDVLAVAGANLSRRLKRWRIFNDHATVSNTVTPQRVTAAGTFPDMKFTLLAQESALCNEAGTWFIYDAQGRVKASTTMAIDPASNDFRLSGVSVTPVMTADNSALGTIFLAQYKGNSIALYDGVNWQLCRPASEVSLAVTGRTTDLPFDIFAFMSAGVVTLEFLNWTNATTRATGLTRVDGVWTKTGDSTRRYLGSCRARSATTYSWVTAGLDTGTSVRLDLWNENNRVEVSFTLRAGANTWSYTTATWRQAQALATMQADIMVGRQEDWFRADLKVSSRNSTISIPRHVGIGFDTTTALSGTVSATANTVASIEADQHAAITNQPTLGRHFYAWNEISTATGTCTWIGDDGALRLQSGMTGAWPC